MCSDDHRFFGGKGYAPAFADWAASRAIAVDSSLHVLHLWPRAVGAGGKQRLTDARRLAALECASDGGVLYEKKVRLGRGALHRYLRSAYGDVSWIRPSNYEAHDGLAPLVVFVLHSSAVRMSACKQRVRDLFNLSTDTVQRKAACHATDTHTEAIVAAQLLLNDNSIAALHAAGTGEDLKASASPDHKPVGVRGSSGALGQRAAPTQLGASFRSVRVARSVCERVTADIGNDLTAVGAAPTVVQHKHRVRSTQFVLPEGLLVDTGAAMALANLRALTDIDLVWAEGAERSAPLLLRHCGQHGRRRKGERACRHSYGSHNPPTLWFGFHNVSEPAELLDDPTLHGFCAGVKFVAPEQLLLYKQRRFAARREAKDWLDAARLVNLSYEICSSQLGTQSAPSRTQCGCVQNRWAESQRTQLVSGRCRTDSRALLVDAHDDAHDDKACGRGDRAHPPNQSSTCLSDWMRGIAAIACREARCVQHARCTGGSKDFSCRTCVRKRGFCRCWEPACDRVRAAYEGTTSIAGFAAEADT